MVAWEDGLEAALPLYEQGLADAEAAGAVGARYSMEYGIAQYMSFAGQFAEARDRCERLLASPAPVEHFGQWANAVLALSRAMLGEVDRAADAVVETVAYARAAGDHMTLSMALWIEMLVAVAQGDARRRAAMPRTRSRRPRSISGRSPTFGRGMAPQSSRSRRAIPLLRSPAWNAGSRCSERQPILVFAFLAQVSADALIALGRDREAATALDEILAVTTSERGPAHRLAALVSLARVELRAGRSEDAEAHLHEALALAQPMGSKRGVVDALEVLGICARRPRQQRGGGPAPRGRRARCATAAGTSSARRPSRPPTTPRSASLRQTMGAAFEVAWSEGESLSLSKRPASTRPEDGASASGRRRAGRRSRRRKHKVAALVAEGLTNVQVGERLFISRHTVDSHLRHIYAKLGVSNRAELATRRGSPRWRRRVMFSEVGSRIMAP